MVQPSMMYCIIEHIWIAASSTASYTTVHESSKSDPHQGHPFSVAHWRTERCPPSAALQQVPSSQGYPISINHWRMESCPPAAAALHVSPASQQSQPIIYRQLEDGEMPTCSCSVSCIIVPTAVVLSQPLQTSKLPILGSSYAHLLTDIPPSPLELFIVPNPGVSLSVGPFHDVNAAISRTIVPK
jgi:hypothetical protein